MGLDEELESMEETGETEAEWTDQETELQDAEDDEDEIFGEDAAEAQGMSTILRLLFLGGASTVVAVAVAVLLFMWHGGEFLHR